MLQKIWNLKDLNSRMHAILVLLRYCRYIDHVKSFLIINTAGAKMTFKSHFRPNCGIDVEWIIIPIQAIQYSLSRTCLEFGDFIRFPSRWSLIAWFFRTLRTAVSTLLWVASSVGKPVQQRKKNQSLSYIHLPNRHLQEMFFLLGQVPPFPYRKRQWFLFAAQSSSPLMSSGWVWWFQCSARHQHPAPSLLSTTNRKRKYPLSVVPEEIWRLPFRRNWRLRIPFLWNPGSTDTLATLWIGDLHQQEAKCLTKFVEKM